MSAGMFAWSVFCVGLGVALCLYAQRCIRERDWARKLSARIKDWADGD